MIQVGDLVKSINLGAHTTSSARLFHLPQGGSIVDSPGIREFGLWSLSNDDIEQGFVEIAGNLCHPRYIKKLN